MRKTIVPVHASGDAGGYHQALATKKQRLIDAHEAEDRCGFSRWSLWRGEKAGTFPRSLKIGGKRVWIESEVEQWIEDRIRERD